MNKTKTLVATLILLALPITVGASWFSDLFYKNDNLNFGATTLKVPNGGTGATSFNSGECLVGNGTGAITTQACGAGGGSGTVSTSTNEVAGRIPYWTSNSGTPALLGQIATTTASCSGDASCTPFTIIGTSPIDITATAGAGSIDGTGIGGMATVWVDSNTVTSSSTLSVNNFVATSSTALNIFPNLSNTYASSTYASFTTASTTNLRMNGQTFNNLLGTGLQNVGSALTLNATGDWTGTLDGFNGFGFPFTVSANYNSTTTRLAMLGGLNASTTSLIDYATTTAFTVSSLYAPNLTSALTLTGSDGLFAEYAGTSCTNQFVRSLSALGVATCATVANTDLANSTISGVALGSNLNALTNDATLNGSSYNGSSAISDWGLNLANANTWTAKQDFYGNASSTILSAHWLKVGSSASTTIDTAGNVSLPSAGLLTFPYSSSTIYSSYATASTSAQVISNSLNIFGGGAKTTANALCQQLTGSADLCDGSDATGAGGGTFPFTSVTGYNSTSTVLGLLGGFFSTASSTISGDFYTPSLTQGYLYVGTNGINKTVATSTLAGQVFPFTSATGYNSTSTALGLLGGFFSTASSTVSGDLYLPALTQGFRYSGSNGITRTISTSTLAGQVFPFTSATGYNSTSTVLGLTGGFFSTASSTISSSLYLPSLTAGYTYTGSSGVVNTVSTSTMANQVVALTPYRLGFAYATTTWTGTSTIYLGPAFRASTVNYAYCETDAGTVGVSLYDATNRANYMPTASTTINKFTYTTNNTFTIGESMRVDIGNPASSPTKLSCSFDVLITP